MQEAKIMKGTISDTAAKILNKPDALEQLNRALDQLHQTGTGGKVTVDGKTYSVQRTYNPIQPSVSGKGGSRHTTRSKD
jgi:hypothetical protein